MAVAPPSPHDVAADRAAVLYVRHSEAVLRHCRFRLRSREEAEEAAQTTFLRALSALRRGEAPHSERAWLMAIARNVCTDVATAASRRREIGVDPEQIADTHSAQAIDLPARDVEEALAELPASQRHALVLREWHGLTYREIADELAVSLATVESRIFRARRSLAVALERGRRFVADLPSLGALIRMLLPGGGVAAKAAAVAALLVTAVALEGAAAESSRLDARPGVAGAASEHDGTRATPGRPHDGVVFGPNRDEARTRTGADEPGAGKTHGPDRGDGAKPRAEAGTGAASSGSSTTDPALLPELAVPDLGVGLDVPELSVPELAVPELPAAELPGLEAPTLLDTDTTTVPLDTPTLPDASLPTLDTDTTLP